MARRDHTIVISIVGAVVVHAALGGGVGAAKYFGMFDKPKDPPIVMFEVTPPPPPPEPEPEPPKPPEPEPPKPPEPEPEAPKPEPPKAPPKAPPKDPPPVQPDTPPPETPPPADAPPPQGQPEPEPEYTYRMPSSGTGGTMGVQQGQSSGTPGGKPSGKPGGKGDGPQGTPDGTGDGPVVASVAAIKTMPKPIGDYDSVDASRYPGEAKRAGVQGKVRLQLVIDAEGKVTKVTLKQGLGYGLDELALSEAKKLRFEPAIDTNGKAVATTIPWTFNFELPE